MNVINDGCKVGGVFGFGHIRGVKGVLDQARKVAILNEGGAEALVHHYIRHMQGVEIDAWQAHNRFVGQGLALVNAFLKGDTAVTPTKVQLGSGSTAAWDGSLSAVRTVPAGYAAGGLAEATADTIAYGVSTPYANDTLIWTKDFTCTAVGGFTGASAPDEVMIRNTTPKALCYAWFSARDLAQNDHLIVTYNFRLVP